jgi:hypothetical protein
VYLAACRLANFHDSLRAARYTVDSYTTGPGSSLFFLGRSILTSGTVTRHGKVSYGRISLQCGGGLGTGKPPRGDCGRHKVANVPLSLVYLRHGLSVSGGGRSRRSFNFRNCDARGFYYPQPVPISTSGISTIVFPALSPVSVFDPAIPNITVHADIYYRYNQPAGREEPG